MGAAVIWLGTKAQPEDDKTGLSSKGRCARNATLQYWARGLTCSAHHIQPLAAYRRLSRRRLGAPRPTGETP